MDVVHVCSGMIVVVLEVICDPSSTHLICRFTVYVLCLRTGRLAKFVPFDACIRQQDDDLEGDIGIGRLLSLTRREFLPDQCCG